MAKIEIVHKQKWKKIFMKIMKFGGSSVGTPESMQQVVNIIEDSVQKEQTIVVVSALGGVTDLLIDMAATASKGEQSYQEILLLIESKHINTINKTIPAAMRSDVLTSFKLMLNELEDVLQGVFLTRELTTKTLDFITGFGERFSASVLSEMINQTSLSSVYTDARKLLKTDRNFGNARLLTAESFKNIRSYVAENLSDVIVVTGFIASTEQGESTTLGRGGSDYTASIFGAALQAESIEIWTDVDGLMTADPKKVDRAFSVEATSYEEAMELSHFGAKVIYPPTIQPALKSNIPIRIKNTFKPAHPGTLINSSPQGRRGAIRGISSIDSISLITLKGSGMIGLIGVSARMFSALSAKHINIILITQSSSEHTITVAVMPSDAEEARNAIYHEFSEEFKAELMDEIKVEHNLSVIAVVGDNMRQIPGIAGRVFQSLGRNGINIVAIAQGSSERNISFVVDQKNEKKAMNTLHDAFFLAGVKSVNIYLVGVGLIGNRLLEIIREQKDVFFKNYQIDINLKGLANSREMLLSEKNISLKNWKEQLSDSGSDTNLRGFVDGMKEMNLPNSIFIDCTASSDLQHFYREILASSISVVTPNKLANSSDQTFFNKLQKTANRYNSAFKYETNVGAGLPVIGTLHEMISTGDDIYRIEGVLSGTLSYLFNTYDGTVPFSELVKQAREKGYTEPDPREDLNGHDVGRKLLILARVAGFELEFDDIEIENLVPEQARNAESMEQFFKKLAESDKEFEIQAKSATGDRKKLCYIAAFEEGKATVKLEMIPAGHPFYNLSSTDNIIAIYSANYNENPLVVKGPGAGADVTASGIIADMLRVVNTKAQSNAGW